MIVLVAGAGDPFGRRVRKALRGRGHEVLWLDAERSLDDLEVTLELSGSTVEGRLGMAGGPVADLSDLDGVVVLTDEGWPPNRRLKDTDREYLHAERVATLWALFDHLDVPRVGPPGSGSFANMHCAGLGLPRALGERGLDLAEVAVVFDADRARDLAADAEGWVGWAEATSRGTLHCARPDVAVRSLDHMGLETGYVVWIGSGGRWFRAGFVGDAVEVWERVDGGYRPVEPGAFGDSFRMGLDALRGLGFEGGRVCFEALEDGRIVWWNVASDVRPEASDASSAARMAGYVADVFPRSSR